ncbi:DUF805 domain-containing protein [Asticcacaulis sp. YBE204]|uniref:DUF805 domain-containing protein n=1 Tax=Asticcacaulis sp. YBE204 TaxID=1282363 RepID=UPI0003C3AF5B|nr:DUF805 domain-containing protein [Asticcacaulis sp. YBE204]ESQ80507.1 hypothetical protein AEYBE204_04370 [Asticcacaulis sp. YBE204]
MLKFIFSLQGRIARLSFLWGMLAAYGFMIFAFGSLYYFVGTLDIDIDLYMDVMPGIMIGFGFLMCWVFFCLTSKRLHDVGAPGWPAVLLFAPVASALFMYGRHYLGMGVTSPTTSQVFQSVYNGLWALGFLILLFWPGQKRANRYGPPPGQRPMTDVAVFE